MPRLTLSPLLIMTLLAGCSATSTDQPGSDKPIPIDELVDALGLENHVEGGYFRRTYESGHRPMIETKGGKRFLMTSIYYLLTESSPIGHFHLNKSDILHYHHKGDPIRYYLIQKDGTFETVILGQDVAAGQRLQLHVPGGVWKASELLQGTHGFGLISEAVSPGFDYEDMTLGTKAQLTDQFPEHASLFDELTRK